MSFDFAVIISNAEFLLLQGLLGIGRFGGGTLCLAIPAIILGFAVGIILGLARLARRPWIHYPAAIYIELIRGIPLVMLIFWFWFLVPVVIGRPAPEYWVALTAFVIFEGAYIGEIVRAGIQSVPRGQIDAATAAGLNYTQTMGSVILPQAIRNVIPSLVTQFIVLFKDTSLASIIGMMDLTKAAQTVSQRELRPFEMYLFIALVYWACTYSMSCFSRWLEVRLSPERAPAR
ncbi:MAG TPA: amino acid ABC transporter permease [Thermodesulfobacteriota bacterium]|nr:amino acid ABC transporter permease [Thermodesulfobacteriota bacterium]